MDHRKSRPSAAAFAAMALLLLPAAAMAAAPTYGRWSEKDLSNLDFDIQPGAKPNQLMLVIPSSVNFPGSHQFTLAKRPDGAFASQEPGRPKVLLTFESASKARLKVHGQGATKTDTWISMNNYTLVRR